MSANSFEVEGSQGKLFVQQLSDSGAEGGQPLVYYSDQDMVTIEKPAAKVQQKKSEVPSLPLKNLGKGADSSSAASAVVLASTRSAFPSARSTGRLMSRAVSLPKLPLVKAVKESVGAFLSSRITPGREGRKTSDLRMRVAETRLSQGGESSAPLHSTRSEPDLRKTLKGPETKEKDCLPQQEALTSRVPTPAAPKSARPRRGRSASRALSLPRLGLPSTSSIMASAVSARSSISTKDDSSGDQRPSGSYSSRSAGGSGRGAVALLRSSSWAGSGAPARDEDVSNPLREAKARQRKGAELLGHGFVAQRVAEIETAGADSVLDQMLLRLYHRELEASERQTVLHGCPELDWLAQCAMACPLPPGWSYYKAGSRSVAYINESTNEMKTDHPNLAKFVRLAHSTVQARMNPEIALTMASDIDQVGKKAEREASSLKTCWTGPHRDVATGMQYYHCPSAGVSSWQNPASETLYIAHVVEQLLHSIAFRPSKAEKKDRSSDQLNSNSSNSSNNHNSNSSNSNNSNSSSINNTNSNSDDCGDVNSAEKSKKSSKTRSKEEKGASRRSCKELPVSAVVSDGSSDSESATIMKQKQSPCTLDAKQAKFDEDLKIVDLVDGQPLTARSTSAGSDSADTSNEGSWSKAAGDATSEDEDQPAKSDFQKSLSPRSAKRMVDDILEEDVTSASDTDGQDDNACGEEMECDESHRPTVGEQEGAEQHQQQRKQRQQQQQQEQQQQQQQQQRPQQPQQSAVDEQQEQPQEEEVQILAAFGIDVISDEMTTTTTATTTTTTNNSNNNSNNNNTTNSSNNSNISNSIADGNSKSEVDVGLYDSKTPSNSDAEADKKKRKSLKSALKKKAEVSASVPSLNLSSLKPLEPKSLPSPPKALKSALKKTSTTIPVPVMDLSSLKPSPPTSLPRFAPTPRLPGGAPQPQTHRPRPGTPAVLLSERGALSERSAQEMSGQMVRRSSFSSLPSLPEASQGSLATLMKESPRPESLSARKERLSWEVVKEDLTLCGVNDDSKLLRLEAICNSFKDTQTKIRSSSSTRSRLGSIPPPPPPPSARPKTPPASPPTPLTSPVIELS